MDIHAKLGSSFGAKGKKCCRIYSAEPSSGSMDSSFNGGMGSGGIDDVGAILPFHCPNDTVSVSLGSGGGRASGLRVLGVLGEGGALS